jgi:hypothetical protein
MNTPLNGPTIGYGPGDEETWAPFAGHPNDPRNDGDEDDEEAYELAREQWEVDRYQDRQDWG